MGGPLIIKIRDCRERKAATLLRSPHGSHTCRHDRHSLNKEVAAVIRHSGRTQDRTGDACDRALKKERDCHVKNVVKKILAHMTRTRVHSPTRSPHPLSLIRTIDPAAHCLLGTYYRGQGEGRGRGNRLCLVFSLSAVGLTLGCDSLPRRALLLTACITALFSSLVHRSISGRLLP